MTRIDVANGAGLVSAVVLSAVIMGLGAQPADVVVSRGADATAAIRELAIDEDGGQRFLTDATGVHVPLRDYQRIVAASLPSRALLIELTEQRRIVGVISAGLDESAQAFRYDGIERVESMNDIERLLVLQPDLVITNRLGSAKAVARLREAGINLVVLGDMTGTESLIRDAVAIGHLVGAPQRGRRFARRFTRAIAAVAAGIPASKRKSAMYLSSYGSTFFGGTQGTSYHDVLQAAGLDDVAAVEFAGWPQYSPEHLLSLDPEVIVAPTGTGKRVCANASLARLQACQNRGFVELPAALLEDAGPAMLDSAQRIHHAVYGIASP